MSIRPPSAVATVMVFTLLAGLLACTYRPASAAAARFAVTNVSLNASQANYATDISNTGLVLGIEWVLSTQRYNAYAVNSDGSGALRLRSSGDSMPWDISPNGVALAGNYPYSAGTSFIYTREQGTSYLATPTIPVSVNDARVVTGNRTVSGATRAFRYYSATNAIETLPLPAGAVASGGVGINNDGDVVGWARDGGGANYFMTYAGGVASKIALPTGWTTGSLTEVSDTGFAVGEVITLTYPRSSRGILYAGLGNSIPGTSVRVLPLLTNHPQAVGEATGVNRHGVAVGYSSDPDTGERAVIYDGDSVIDLNTLIDPASGWVLRNAAGINDLGQIVGRGSVSGKMQAFVLTPASATAWNVNADGAWTADANWSAGAPHASNVAVTFGGAIAAPRTVSVASPRAVGTLTFDNAGAGYTLANAGGQGAVTTDVLGGQARVAAVRGSHAIGVPLLMNSDTDVDVAEGAGLRLSRVSTPYGKTLRKQGAGTLRVDAFASGRLEIEAGGVEVTSNGSSTLDGLVLAEGTSFDVGRARVTINLANAAAAVPLLDAVRAAYDGGRWDLPGIFAAGARDDASHATGVGYAVSAGALVLRYTWLGDANLDGVVNRTDLLAVDGGRLLAEGSCAWQQGDFNYDGRVSADDYALLGVGLSSSGGANIVTRVPEPSSCAAALLAAVGMARARRPLCRSSPVRVPVR